MICRSSLGDYYMEMKISSVKLKPSIIHIIHLQSELLWIALTVKLHSLVFFYNLYIIAYQKQVSAKIISKTILNNTPWLFTDNDPSLHFNACGINMFIYLFIFQVSYFGLCYLQILNEQKRFFFLLLFVKRFMFENNIACCV